MDNQVKVLNYPLDFLLGDRFGKYSKYIIQERALPDVRDGLKPVQRRIIYAMLVNGNIPSKAYRKSATAVGFIIGHYHPHGDTSVYDAMVRMSQWWKQSMPLVEMHGNNGSLDDDPPAAMRYTEARLSPISMELLRDIDKDTVNFAPNYDDTDEEPTVLPARFPHLLINGAEGIAAGYSTYIPPHNFKEICEATIYRIKNPKCSLDEIMEIVPGPDFPTGGIIRGKEGIKEALGTGSGSFQVVAKTEIVNQKNNIALVVHEIPFGVVKSLLVASIDKIRNDKEIDGIIEVRDESDRTGLRIVVEMRKEADVNAIVNYLMKKTKLACRYTYNTIVICDKKPLKLGIIPILDYYIDYQIEVINRRVSFDLKKAQARLHIVEGMAVAISNIDELIAIVRSSKSKDEIKKRLMVRFNLDEAQTEAIVTIQLHRLNSVDIADLYDECKKLESIVADLSSIHDNEKKIKGIIVSELSEIVKKYPCKRLSKIEDEVAEFTVEKKPIIKEDVMIAVTKDGYFKRSSIKSYTASKGANPGCKNGDILVSVGKANTSDVLLAFTDKANFLYIPVFELSESKWKDEGKHISNIISLSGDEKIVFTVLVKEFKEGVNLVLCSKSGLIKRSKLTDFVIQRYSKPVMAMKITDSDNIIGVSYTDGDSNIIVLTKKGKMIQYHESKVSLVGVRAAGVKAIVLDNDDEVSSLVCLNKGSKNNVMVLTDRGGFKTFNPSNIISGARLAKPLEVYKFYRSEPHYLIGSCSLVEPYRVAVLSSTQGSRDITFDAKTMPLGKSIRSTLLASKDEKLLGLSDVCLSIIDSNTKTYEYVEKKPEKVATPAEEVEERTITIFDYLDDLK